MKLKHLFLVFLAISASNASTVEGETINTWVLFLGRFHPLIVHFPIAIVGLLFLLWFVNIILKRPLINSNSINLGILAFISSLFSILLGRFLASEGGYDEVALEWHERMGYFLTFFSGVVLLISIGFAKSGNSLINIIYSLSVLITTFFMISTGHLGGNLTHGENYLTEHNPLKTKPKTKKLESIDSAFVFEDIIQPIFNKKCVSCHGASKIKGDLRLDSYDWCLKQGESGKTFVSLKPEESEIMVVVNLNPKEEPERAMPPEGKTPLTDDEKKLLAWWIKTGLGKNKKVADLMPDEEIKAILNKNIALENSGNNDVSQPKSIFDKVKVEPIDSETLSTFKEKGIFIIPIVAGSNLVAIRFEYPEGISDKEIISLLSIKDNITELYLNNTSISDSSFVNIQNFKNLSRLHLENTKISNKAIEYLEKCTFLEYLNLYNTVIDEKSLSSIKKINNLKELYLWKTNFDTSSTADLKIKINKVVF